MSEPTRAGDIDQALLGGPLRYTRAEIEQHSGVPDERSHRLWRALGLPDVDPDERAFTDADVESLRIVTGLLDDGLLDEDTVVAVARTMGQALARLAESEIGVLTDLVLRRIAADGLPAGDDVVAPLLDAGLRLLPEMDRLVLHVWHRQVAAVIGRTLAPAALDATPVVTVGFTDLVGFTELSRSLSGPDLAALVERFEAEMSDRVVEHGGRVVKTLGDEVLYVVSDVAGAADIALVTAEVHAADAALPDVRTGLATGHVVARHGDVYGPVVNIASRLTSLARPATVLVDREAATLLRDRAPYVVKPVPPHAVRGYRHLHPYVVRFAPYDGG